MQSNGKNHQSHTRLRLKCATSLFLPHFDVIFDLLLNRHSATWNLFVKYYIYLYNFTERVHVRINFKF